MTSTAAAQGASSSSLDHYLRGLRVILDDPEVTEVCINRPFEAFVERRTGWSQERLAFASLHWCESLARLAAVATHQRIAPECPLLAAALPSGERIQVVIPPACSVGSVAITIRKPSQNVWTLGELAAKGMFQRCAAKLDVDGNEELAELHRSSAYEDFLRLAVRLRKNIIVSGPTGSGKTTFTKALLLEIPAHERLITIEDAKELNLDAHPNSVRLVLFEEAQGLARVTPKQLLEACLRMRPDRILLAELRSDEAYYYLRNVNSGHPGSITSVHASSATLAFEQLVLLVKESPGGQDQSREDIKSLLHLLVDVVVQFAVEGQERFVKEVWFSSGADSRSRRAA